MTLDLLDLAWNFVIIALGFAGLWKTWRNWKQYWKTWPWHAALSIAWMVAVPINFATGDTVMAWIAVGLSIVEGYNWITNQNRAKTEAAKAAERAEAQRKLFESFRIDK